MRVIENNGKPDAWFSSAISGIPILWCPVPGRTIFADRFQQVAGWKVR